jgi:hypothetical protein
LQILKKISIHVESWSSRLNFFQNGYWQKLIANIFCYFIGPISSKERERAVFPSTLLHENSMWIYVNWEGKVVVMQPATLSYNVLRFSLLSFFFSPRLARASKSICV